MIAVAASTLLCPPIRVSRLVASAEARMLTILLPNRTEPIILSLSSISSSAVRARLEPLSAITCSLALLAAVSAVSEPEKKAEQARRTAMPITVPQIDQSMLAKVSERLCMV